MIDTSPESVAALAKKCADLAAFDEWKVGYALATSREPIGIFGDVAAALVALAAEGDALRAQLAEFRGHE